MSRAPGISPGLTGGSLCSLNSPVFGFSTPSHIALSSVYQRLPLESVCESCGTVSFRGMSHVVMITLPATPFGRGRRRSSYEYFVLPPLRLYLARKSASSFLRIGPPDGLYSHQFGDFSARSCSSFVFIMVRPRPAVPMTVPSG